MPDIVLPWLKAIHFIALLVWCACLVSMPGLFAGHRSIRGAADAVDMQALNRFVYIAIASPAAIFAIASGAALIHPTAAYAGWLPLKLTLVAMMTGLHLLCGRGVITLHDRPKGWPSRYWLAMTFAPAPLIAGVLYLVLAKPI